MREMPTIKVVFEIEYKTKKRKQRNKHTQYFELKKETQTEIDKAIKEYIDSLADPTGELRDEYAHNVIWDQNHEEFEKRRNKYHCTRIISTELVTHTPDPQPKTEPKEYKPSHG